MRAALALLCWLGTLVPVFTADKTADKTKAEERWRKLMEGPHVKRGRMPAVKLQRSIRATLEEQAQIKKHIANLANIERPDFGLSATLSGMAFAPVPGSGETTGGFLLTNHRLQTSDDVRELVALGPRALPFLLQALDDKTPTRMTISRENAMFMVMELGNELSGNPTNSLEQKGLAALPKREWNGQSLRDYTVKVGDVCFAIIGQIVGREYNTVRYQPTAIVIINSPLERRELATAVRDIWSSTNAAQRLFDSLLFDYATEGVFNGESLDGWGIASDLQCQAAMRLLYYFPRETSEVIAKRLAGLHVAAPSERRIDHMRREVMNGVGTKDFIKAAAWCKEPAIRREILDIFKRSTDATLLLAALPGIEVKETNLISRRLNELIDQLPPDESGPYGSGYNLLVALGEKLGAGAKPTFIRYLQKPSLQRWRTMAQVLRKTRCEWAVELLLPALTDKREFGWTYALVPDQNEPRRPIRVCDEAAQTISLSRPDLRFKMAGEHEDLDRQIAAMQARIMGWGP